LPIETEQFVRRLEHALEAERIPYAIVGGDLMEWALERPRWTVLASSGALESQILETTRRAFAAGRPLSLGPRAPNRDAMLTPLRHPPELPHRSAAGRALIGLDRAEISAAVAEAKSSLGLATLPATPDAVFATVHHDSSGHAAVLFVLNPSNDDLDVSVDSAGALEAVDALDGERLRAEGGRLALRMIKRSAVMLELRREP
jgi:hypothetical protein